MSLKESLIRSENYVFTGKLKDRQPRWFTLEQDIRVLSAEIVRLSKLPYSSWANINKIRSLDQQIQYLEELISVYQRDQKNLE